MEIAISSWSFHDDLYSGRLRLADVPYRVHDLGYRAVELQDMFLFPRPPNIIARLFGRKTPPFDRYRYDRRALLKLRLNRLRSGTRLVCWTIDSDFTVTNGPGEGSANAENDQAAYDRALDLMSSVLPVAMARNIKFAVENHGGLSANLDLLVNFVQQFHSPHLGICLDFGNFVGDRADGVRQLAPYTIHVHAKSRAFDAQGEETQINYRMCLNALKAAHYDGVLSIEYEGDGDPVAGIKQTHALIAKWW